MSGARSAEHPQVREHGAGVAAGDRAGQRAVAVAQRVVQRGGQQRAEHPLRVADPGAAQQVRGLGDQRDQVVRAVRERGVVERAGRVGHPDRLRAHLDDQRLADVPRRLVAVGRGDADAAGGHPFEVLGAAGERHHRVQRERQRAGSRRGRARRRRARRRCARRSGRGAARRRPRGRGPCRRARRPAAPAAPGRRGGPPRPAAAAGRRAAASRPAARTRADTPDAATTVWPARASAAPSTAPTRPAETTPTARRAGRFMTPPLFRLTRRNFTATPAGAPGRARAAAPRSACRTAMSRASRSGASAPASPRRPACQRNASSVTAAW